MKTCFKCLQKKPLADFYKHGRMADGHLNKCKECAKIDVRAEYRANRKKKQEYERKRAKLPHRKKRARELAMRHRDKTVARAALAYSVKTGKVQPKPCEECGSKQVQAHHEDYSKPLDVVWLCFAHHRARHGQLADATSGIRYFTAE